MQHPLSYVNPDAQIGKDVEIGPFVTIDKNVVIGDGTRIMSNATILEGARIGKNCTIFPGAVVSAIPQDLKFKGEETTAEIGDNTTLREYVTVNRGTASKGKTVIGNNFTRCECEKWNWRHCWPEYPIMRRNMLCFAGR